jgi:hypothetical protein
VEVLLTANGRQIAPSNPSDLHTALAHTSRIDPHGPGLQIALTPLQLMRMSAVSHGGPIVWTKALPISVTVSIFTVMSSSSSHSLLTLPSSSLPLHWLYTKSYNTSQSLLVRCTAMPFWYTLTKSYIYISWFLNLLQLMKIHNFLHRWW